MKIVGIILYDGVSLIDGETPIIAMASWNQDNPKTGDMIQTRILNRDVPPTTALTNGGDASVCGECPRRPSLADSSGLKPCYVEVGGSPERDWNAFHGGEIDPQSIPDLPIRLGSYGDPVAIPNKVWEELISIHDQKWTGYTHQWHTEHGQDYKHLCMASCDTLEETNEAIAKGWRTYSALTPEQHKESPLAQCPASEESTIKLTCVQCMACNGAPTGNKRASIKIISHD